MKWTILSLFPDIFTGYFGQSIMKRAIQKGLISYELINIRDYAHDKHKSCDDTPYGGGAGMLLLAGPLGEALDAVKAYKKTVVYVTPSGRSFTQEVAKELCLKQEVVLIAGRYEGIDERIIDSYVDYELSIGDYVMSSGEVAAMVIVDTVYRLIDGVIKSSSLSEESYTGGLLEYPQYTKPSVWRELSVPSVLLSGNHEAIRKWRLEARLLKTLRYRPELIARAKDRGEFTSECAKLLEGICRRP